MDTEYVIKNVKIYDGTGKKPFVSDVYIKGGKIVRIGDGFSIPEEIDGTGLCLAPGFVDAHTHSDNQMFLDPDRKAKVKMGVTSEIGGQCGWSRAPFASFMPKTAREYFQSVNGNPEHSPQIETFAELVERGNKLGLGAHQKSFTGHCMLRGSVVGMENREMTAKELDTACGLLEETMQQGSMGLSTGLVYSPSQYGTTDEIIALAKVAAKHGGMYTSHIRNESDFVEEAVAEAINIAKKADIKLNISHLKAMFPQNYHKAEKLLNMIDEANRDGCDITFDVYPYDACSASILSTLPPSYLSHGVDWLVEHLSGEENLEILRKAFYEPTEKWENPVLNIGLGNMLICRSASLPEAIGKTVEEYAKMKGIDPIAAYAEIIAVNRAAVSDIRFCMSEDIIAELYKHPRCMVGTDGIYTWGHKLAHPRHFGTFPRFLGRYVRERKIMPMEEAIRRITSMPCETYGLKNKGYVKEGYDADLVLFDEKTIIDHADYLSPFTPNEGIKAVFVMGGIAVLDGVYTNLRNGIFYKR